MVAYNLEWFGGLVHNDFGFAASWGAFPLLTGYYAQHWSISVGAWLAAVGAFGLSFAQRVLSTQARWLRRSVRDLDARGTLNNGTSVELTIPGLLRPIETALRAVSWSLVAVAAGMVIAAR